MAVIFQDSFTTGSGVLEGNVPDTLGTSWSLDANSFPSSSSVSGGQCNTAFLSSDPSYVHALPAPTSTDLVITTNVGFSGTTTGGDPNLVGPGVYWNFQDAGTLYAVTFLPDSLGRLAVIELSVMQSWTKTVLGTYTDSAELSGPVVITSQAGTHTVSYNGIDVITATDSSITTAGSCGLALANQLTDPPPGTDMPFLDFTVEELTGTGPLVPFDGTATLSANGYIAIVNGAASLASTASISASGYTTLQFGQLSLSAVSSAYLNLTFPYSDYEVVSYRFKDPTTKLNDPAWIADLNTPLYNVKPGEKIRIRWLVRTGNVPNKNIYFVPVYRKNGGEWKVFYTTRDVRRGELCKTSLDIADVGIVQAYPVNSITRDASVEETKIYTPSSSSLISIDRSSLEFVQVGQGIPYVGSYPKFTKTNNYCFKCSVTSTADIVYTVSDDGGITWSPVKTLDYGEGVGGHPYHALNYNFSLFVDSSSRAHIIYTDTYNLHNSDPAEYATVEAVSSIGIVSFPASEASTLGLPFKHIKTFYDSSTDTAFSLSQDKDGFLHYSIRQGTSWRYINSSPETVISISDINIYKVRSNDNIWHILVSSSSFSFVYLLCDFARESVYFFRPNKYKTTNYFSGVSIFGLHNNVIPFLLAGYNEFEYLLYYVDTYTGGMKETGQKVFLPIDNSLQLSSNFYWDSADGFVCLYDQASNLYTSKFVVLKDSCIGNLDTADEYTPILSTSPNFASFKNLGFSYGELVIHDNAVLPDVFNPKKEVPANSEYEVELEFIASDKFIGGKYEIALLSPYDTRIPYSNLVYHTYFFNRDFDEYLQATGSPHPDLELVDVYVLYVPELGRYIYTLHDTSLGYTPGSPGKGTISFFTGADSRLASDLLVITNRSAFTYVSNSSDTLNISVSIYDPVTGDLIRRTDLYDPLVVITKTSINLDNPEDIVRVVITIYTYGDIFSDIPVGISEIILRRPFDIRKANGPKLSEPFYDGYSFVNSVYPTVYTDAAHIEMSGVASVSMDPTGSITTVKAQSAPLGWSTAYLRADKRGNQFGSFVPNKPARADLTLDGYIRLSIESGPVSMAAAATISAGGEAVSVRQIAYQFRLDDGDQNTATWIGFPNRRTNLAIGSSYRCRIAVENTALASRNIAEHFQLEISINGGAWVDFTEYTKNAGYLSFTKNTFYHRVPEPNILSTIDISNEVLTDGTLEIWPFETATFIDPTGVWHVLYVGILPGSFLRYLYRRSTDGGATWSDPVEFEAISDTETLSAWYPRGSEFIWDPTRNRLLVIFSIQMTQVLLSGQENTFVRLLMAHSDDSGATWSDTRYFPFPVYRTTSFKVTPLGDYIVCGWYEALSPTGIPTSYTAISISTSAGYGWTTHRIWPATEQGAQFFCEAEYNSVSNSINVYSLLESNPFIIEEARTPVLDLYDAGTLYSYDFNDPNKDLMGLTLLASAPTTLNNTLVVRGGAGTVGGSRYSGMININDPADSTRAVIPVFGKALYAFNTGTNVPVTMFFERANGSWTFNYQEAHQNDFVEQGSLSWGNSVQLSVGGKPFVYSLPASDTDLASFAILGRNKPLFFEPLPNPGSATSHRTQLSYNDQYGVIGAFTDTNRTPNPKLYITQIMASSVFSSDNDGESIDQYLTSGSTYTYTSPNTNLALYGRAGFGDYDISGNSVEEIEFAFTVDPSIFVENDVVCLRIKGLHEYENTACFVASPLAVDFIASATAIFRADTGSPRMNLVGSGTVVHTSQLVATARPTRFGAFAYLQLSSVSDTAASASLMSEAAIITSSSTSLTQTLSIYGAASLTSDGFRTASWPVFFTSTATSAFLEPYVETAVSSSVMGRAYLVGKFEVVRPGQITLRGNAYAPFWRSSVQELCTSAQIVLEPNYLYAVKPATLVLWEPNPVLKIVRPTVPDVVIVKAQTKVLVI